MMKQDLLRRSVAFGIFFDAIKMFFSSALRIFFLASLSLPFLAGIISLPFLRSHSVTPLTFPFSSLLPRRVARTLPHGCTLQTPLTLRWNGTVVYFNEGFNASFTANRTLSSPTLFLQSNGILSLADAALGSSPVVVAYSSNYGESGNMLRFVRLDPDGNLRVYSVSSGSSAPTEEWSAVADQCEVFAFCGNMGVCSYNDTAPVCGCPSQNFLPADPADPRQGCRPRTPLQDCQANWTMLQLDNTRFLTYPPQINNEQFFVGITACRQNCLTGQSCVASTALADGSGFCYIVISDFVSGYHSAALPSTSYVKVCAEGGELFDRIVPRGHYTERAAAVVTRTIVEVVQVKGLYEILDECYEPLNQHFTIVENMKNAENASHAEASE